MHTHTASNTSVLDTLTVEDIVVVAAADQRRGSSVIASRRAGMSFGEFSLPRILGFNH